jgi:hypothetical protein
MDTAGDLTQAIVDFRIDYNFASAETLNAFTLQGASRVNGGIVINPAFAPLCLCHRRRLDFPAGDFNSSADLATVKELLANPAGFYVNVHTATSPGEQFAGSSRRIRSDGGRRFREARCDQDQVDAIEKMLRDIGRAGP